MTKEIGSQYKAQREALGLTQQQVADQLGISRTQLSRLENGARNITDEMKSKLDDIFSVNDSLKFEDLEKEYTLDEVYNIAYKAYEDNLIDSVCKFDSKENSYVEIYEQGKQHKYWSTCTTGAINFIQSLYQEEFVIECEDDLKRINLKGEPKVYFLNGFSDKIMGVDYQQDGGNISLYNGEFYIDFNIIKGATVKQHKGIK